MKRKTLFILTSVMILTLAGCGTSKDEPAETPVVSESVETEMETEPVMEEVEEIAEPEEETTEPEEENITNADRGNATGEVTPTEAPEELGGSTSIEDLPEELNPLKDGVTKNADGTYSYTEEFLNAIMSYEYFEGATPEQVKMELDLWGDDLIRKTPEEIHRSFEEIGKNGGRVSEILSFLDNTTSDKNTTNNSNNNTATSNNQGNTSDNSNSNNSSDSNNNSTSGGNNEQEPVGTMDSFFGQDYGFGVGGEQIDSGIVIQ